MPTHTRNDYYYLGGQRVAMRQGVVGQGRDVVYYLHSDHLGSASEVTTGTGGISARQRYAPYGRVRYAYGTMPTTYTYSGQRLDGTGLLYYGARYYDPRLARFVSADTIVPQPGNPQSPNRYAYAYNNPLRYVDPDGHCPAPPEGSGTVICVDLFIQTDTIMGGTAYGDSRLYLCTLDTMVGFRQPVAHITSPAQHRPGTAHAAS